MGLLDRIAAREAAEERGCLLCTNPRGCHAEAGCPDPRHPQYHVGHPYRPAQQRRTFTARDETGRVAL